MERNRRLFSFSVGYAVILAVGLLAGCGGGGSSAGDTQQAPSTPKMLYWAPPTAYTDSSPLNPAMDLQLFEIHVKEAGTFQEGDAPMAYVSAIDPTTGQVSDSFDLSNLSPFLSRGVNYRVSLRAVAIVGTKSDFSQIVSFSL